MVPLSQEVQVRSVACLLTRRRSFSTPWMRAGRIPLLPLVRFFRGADLHLCVLHREWANFNLVFGTCRRNFCAADPDEFGSSADLKKNLFKGIVQWQKRGVESGIIRTVINFAYNRRFFFYVNLKGYSHALNCKKPVSAFRAKKGASVLRGLTDTGLVLTCVKKVTGHGPIRPLPLPIWTHRGRTAT